MKKFIALLIAVVCCLGLFAGCEDPFGDPDEGAENKIVIRVGILPDDNERTLMEAFKQAYEKTHEDIFIRIEDYPETTFINSMAKYIPNKSTMPDVMWMPSDQSRAFTMSGHFLDLTSEFEAVGLDNYYETMIEDTHFSAEDDKIWFAPRDYNKPVLFCNLDIFEAAGIDFQALKGVDENGDPVWTWEKFLETCRTLREAMDTNRDPEKSALGLTRLSYPVDVDLVWNPSYISILGHLSGGAPLVDGTEFTIDSPENIEAYKVLYRDMIAPRLFTNPQTDSRDYFNDHMAAMWVSVRPKLIQASKRISNIDFLPLPTDVIAAGCSGYGVTTVSQDRVSSEAGNTKTNAEHAKEFVMWIASEEGQKVAGETGAGVPVLKSLVNDSSWRNFMSPDLNHEAFVANQDNDTSTNIFKNFSPQYQYNLYMNMNALPVEIGNPNTWKNTPLDDPAGNDEDYRQLNTALSGIKKKLNGALNG